MKIKTYSITVLIVLSVFFNFANAQFDIFEFESDLHQYSADVTASIDGNYVGLAISNDPLNPEERLAVFKFTPDGQVIWEVFLDHEYMEFVGLWLFPDIIALEDGGYAVLYTNDSPQGAVDGFSLLIRLNSSGQELWRQEYECCFYDLLERTNGEIWLGGSVWVEPGETDLQLKKLDENGEEIISWNYFYSETGLNSPEEGFHLSINEQDEIVISGMRNLGVGDIVHLRIAQTGEYLSGVEFGNPDGPDNYQYYAHTPDGGTMYISSYSSLEDFYLLGKVSADGTLAWEKEHSTGIDSRRYYDMIPWNGGAVAVGRYLYQSANPHDAVITFFDGEGNVVNDIKVTIEDKAEELITVLPAHDGGLLFFGRTFSTDGSSNVNPFIFKTDEFGNLFSSFITGQVYRDLNSDCVLDVGEPVLDNILVSLEGANNYTSTLVDGTYSFGVEPGSYTVLPNILSPYWEYCMDSETVNVAENETVEVDFLTKAIVDCPLLEIQHGSDQMRVCQDNVFDFQYCNIGTLPVENVYVELQIDSALEITSSTLVYTEDNGIYTFEIPGEVEVGECESFSVTMFLDCATEIGTTICTNAHIFPDSICLENELWSGASIELTAECNDTEVIFKLGNVGTATSSSIDYIIIEDQVVLNTGNTILAPGEEELFPFPSSNLPLTIFADQEPFHPGFSMPMASVESCDNMGNTGYITMFPPDDADYFIDIECTLAQNSYDPNKKVSFPRGIGEDHILSPNVDIEYTIYFQNTGNDVAFNVRLEDTLSSHLNPLTIRPGSSSHQYDWTLSGSGVLKFFFNGINLPDSTSNEEESQGWVKYRVSQKKDLPVGSLIENRAGIYFDLNPPIITNTVFHNIGVEYLITEIETIEVISDFKVDIFPNPFKSNATLLVENENFERGELKVFNVNGQLIKQESITSKNHELKFEKLPSGIYYLQLNDNERQLWSGKAIIHR